MSAHFYNLECTGCNFENSFTIGGTNYIFIGEYKERPFIKNFGFCRNCKNVTRILEPYKIKHIPVSFQDLQRYEEFKSANSFKRFFRSKSDKAAEEIIERELPRVTYYKNRGHYFSRCMECGNKGLTQIELPSSFSSQKMLINETHTCGGQLIVSYGGRISFSETNTKEFTKDGAINTKAHDLYCMKVAKQAKIETVLEKGLITGFFIYINQPFGKFVLSFRYESSSEIFRQTIDERIHNKDFIDDRALFERGPGPSTADGDDYNSYRIALLNGKLIQKWKPKVDL